VPNDPRLQEARESVGLGDSLAPSTPSLTTDPQPTTDRNLFADIAIGAAAGLEDAARNTLALGNLVPGVDYDVQSDSFIPDAQTGVGRLTQGIFNFLAGFAPAAGILSRLGKVSTVFAASKGFRGAARASRALTRPGVARGTIAGAAADFAVFDGNEERLADVLNDVPALAPLVPDFLESDQDDTELVGRIKNVLEGAGVGLIADGFIAGLKGLRAQRASRAAGDSPEVTQSKVQAASPEAPQQFDTGLDATKEAPEAPSPPALTVQGNDVSPALPETLRTATGRARALKGRLKLDDDQVAQFEQQFRIRRDSGEFPPDLPEQLSKEQKAFLAQLGGDDTKLTRDLIQSDQDVGAFVATVNDLFGPKPTDARVPVPHDAQVAQAAAELDDIVRSEDPAYLLARLAQGAQDDRQALIAINRRSIAYKASLQQYGKEIIETFDNAGGASNPSALAKFSSDLEEFTRFQQEVRGITGEKGRGLEAEKIAGVTVDDLDALAQIAKKGGQQNTEKLVDIIRLGFGEGNLEGAAHMARMAEMTTFQKSVYMIQEFWINSILSGAKTIATNVLAPSIVSTYRPLENMLGGAILRSDPVVTRGVKELQELYSATTDAAIMAKKVFLSGEQQLDPRATTRDDAFARGSVGAINSEVAGLDPSSGAGAAVDWLGRQIRIPSRAIMATDEFIGQINYRAVSKARLSQEALANGVPSDQIAAAITSDFDRLVQDSQAFTIENIRARGLKEAQQAGIKDPVAREKYVGDYLEKNFDPRLSSIAQEGLTRGREAAATTPPTPGSFSASAQRLVKDHPLLKFVVPFINTPVNLLKFAGKRVPNPMGMTEAVLNRSLAGTPAVEQLRTKLAREILSDNPQVAAEAVGRQAAGTGMALTFMTFASQARLTGRGPSDKEQRDALVAAGWQPYSVRVGDKWVSYLRMDPFATIAGTIADMYDTARLAPADEQNNLETAFMGVAIGLANNITNKSYLQGIHDFIAALSNPDRNLERTIGSYAGSIVPNAFAQAVEVFGDDSIRDVNGVVDRIRSRVPGLSDDLPPLRNFLGEPVKRSQGFFFGLEELGPVGDILSMISPLAYRETKDDVISTELVRLQHGFSPPDPQRLGVDFHAFRNGAGQPAYDRWLQLHGSVRIGGRTLRQELRKTIRSTDYQRLTPQSTSSQDSPRIQAIQTIISRYRDEAYDQMVQEFPELERAINDAIRQRQATLEGRGAQFDSFGNSVLPIVPFLGGN